MQPFSRCQSTQLLLVFLAATIAAFGLDVNKPMPHFVARTMDGERITSESIRGKVLLLEFWATWCPPCKKDQPAVENIIKDFENKGLLVLAVNMGEPRRKVKKYLETSPHSAKTVMAEDTTLAAICDANSYPLYVLVNREGNVAGVQRGAGGEGALRRLLSKAGLSSPEP